MKIWSNSFRDGGPIPVQYAFGKYDPLENFALSENRNPHLAWSDLPAGTKSLALICHDSDVPSKPDDVNQVDRTVPADLPRVDFYHWVLVDLQPGGEHIAEDEFCTGVTAKGKPGPDGPRGTRAGVNDYTQWFQGDPSMEGTYFGYDGPAPPWNDERLHHYHFTLYALDVDRLPVDGAFTGPDVLAAMDGHILDKASITGTYHIYPNAK